MIKEGAMSLWQSLSALARTGLIVGSLAIIAAALSVAWIMRGDYQVLFGNLSAQDAGAMTTELDRMKVPYRLDEQGNTILVDKDIVHKTRLKLMGKNLPLSGAVGFELFNNADFGMTEFAQKINYQRALQGELTRTILSLAEVESARVHLALSEDGLFKRANGNSKASITVALRQGQSLRPEQINGIQRLVAAAVPGVTAADVTLVNQQGVALTRSSTGDPGDLDSGGRLDLKKETEQHLTRKAALVLERAFGSGRALASVDVTLNLDQVRITTEDVIPAPMQRNQIATGVVIRERETLRDALAPLVRDAAAGSAGTSQRETEYSVGRRVEQVISQPGSIKRMQVVAVVSKSLDAAQLNQLKTLIGAAVGIVHERGDTVVVQSLENLAGKPAGSISTPNHAMESLMVPDIPVPVLPKGKTTEAYPWSVPTNPVFLAFGILVLIVGCMSVGRRMQGVQAENKPATLGTAERELALAQIVRWTEGGIPGKRS